MAHRPYVKHRIDQLKELVLQNRHSKAVLGPIREELEYRKIAGARQLLKEVRALVEDVVPPPKRTRASRSTDQTDLFVGPRKKGKH